MSRFQHDGAEYSSQDFTSEAGVRLRLWSIEGKDDMADRRTLRIVLLDQPDWESGLGDFLKEIESGRVAPVDRLKEPWRGLIDQRTGPVLFLAPRGVGTSAWPADKDVQIRRRFALLGRTFDGMRARDVLRGVNLLRRNNGFSLYDLPWNFTAVGQAAPVALTAAVLSGKSPLSVTLIDPPTTWRDGPAFLGIDRVMGLPQAATLLHPHPLTLINTPREAWSWTEGFARKLQPDLPWPTFLERKP